MTEYRLFQHGDRFRSLTTSSFDNEFSAERWARSWAADSGSGEDYDIETADGSYSARLFRTVGGQWYIMRT